MADSVVKGKNIDASKVTFSAPKILDNGAKLVYVNHIDQVIFNAYLLELETRRETTGGGWGWF